MASQRLQLADGLRNEAELQLSTVRTAAEAALNDAQRERQFIAIEN